jgi:hypothetical protein
VAFLTRVLKSPDSIFKKNWIFVVAVAWGMAVAWIMTVAGWQWYHSTQRIKAVRMVKKSAIGRLYSARYGGVKSHCQKNALTKKKKKIIIILNFLFIIQIAIPFKIPLILFFI